MTFNVLEDGTILSAQGIKVGIITIDSSKYKDDIIASIETKYPVSLIDDICVDYLPDTDSTCYETIETSLKDISLETIKANYMEIISVINYYK